VLKVLGNNHEKGPIGVQTDFEIKALEVSVRVSFYGFILQLLF